MLLRNMPSTMLESHFSVKRCPCCPVMSADIADILFKVGTSAPDLSTPSSTTKQAIRLLYGQGVAKDLLSAEVSAPRKGKRKRNADDGGPGGNKSDGDGNWTAQAHFTNANYHSKKFVLLLFINSENLLDDRTCRDLGRFVDRLVESSRIKKALEACYTGVLPKGCSPFIYLTIQLDPTTVDVNVHPTKREVHFLEEETITECIADAIQTKLAQSGERTFEYQTLLTGGVAGADTGKSIKGKEKARENSTGNDAASSTPPSGPSAVKKILSQHKVRTSGADRTLDSMFLPTPTQSGEGDNAVARHGVDTVKERRRTREIPQSTCYLTSVSTLRENVKNAKHKELTEILQKHVFVGVVDLVRELSVVQVMTKLYLVNHGALAEELLYQLGLRQFGNLPRLKLDPPAPLRPLITLAVDTEQNTELSKLTKPQIVDSITHTLISRRDMLREYFSLASPLPVLIQDFTPNLDKLPLELECFDTFLRELAYFYNHAHAATSQQEEASEKWQIEHVLFPAMKRYLAAPKSHLTRDVVQIASLPELYRVFERC
ncbi:DNA mismatch repair protein [Lactifluus subvellereus]|nr:DNA mismatch repair protein [Lactifluus subvellereus]